MSSPLGSWPLDRRSNRVDEFPASRPSFRHIFDLPESQSGGSSRTVIGDQHVPSVDPREPESALRTHVRGGYADARIRRPNGSTHPSFGMSSDARRVGRSVRVGGTGRRQLMRDDLTSILVAIEDGQPRAGDQLLPSVYDELRRLAETTTVPGEARPDAPGDGAGPRGVPPGGRRREDAGLGGRGHFFAAAAEAMRRILVEKARAKRRLKRGGDRSRRRSTTRPSPARPTVPPETTSWPSTRP